MGQDQGHHGRLTRGCALPTVSSDSRRTPRVGSQSAHSPQDARSRPSHPIVTNRQKARSAPHRKHPRRSPARPTTRRRPRRPDPGFRESAFAGRRSVHHRGPRAIRRGPAGFPAGPLRPSPARLRRRAGETGNAPSGSGAVPEPAARPAPVRAGGRGGRPPHRVPPLRRLGVLGGLRGVRLASGVAAWAGPPYRDPRAQRLVAPDDRLDLLPAGGADVLPAVHGSSVEPMAAQRLRPYVRTTRPLSRVRTDSSVKAGTAAAERNIGMPEPSTSGYVLITSSSISSISCPATSEPPQR
ncbi:Hypothetical Protein sle_24860 [Streptomyces leeuwenhoekii]|uniref:Uncharacterized protein n=1 Tax=Streptomyces leeuwenhoekii TaxID=1437453 RepID=A0A0F7VWM4_STRLW|nr:Hypothetical Protein sle_24860 [Streptomyces leeuwenhoekii]